jgi:hypothetical protein
MRKPRGLVRRARNERTLGIGRNKKPGSILLTLQDPGTGPRSAGSGR